MVTFGADGFYGHPDHVTIGLVVTAACARRPDIRLFHSHFPRTRLLLLERLAEWLVELRGRFEGPADFARVFSLFAMETSAVGYADDHIEVAWFPPGMAIIEQGEQADTLYLILSGEVEVVQDQPDGSRRSAPPGPGRVLRRARRGPQEPRTAHVISGRSRDLPRLLPPAATPWAGRGATSPLPCLVDGTGEVDPASGRPIIDVRPVIDRKISALAAHRTQYPIDPEMFPRWLLEEMMGHKWFVQAQPRLEPATDLFA